MIKAGVDIDCMGSQADFDTAMSALSKNILKVLHDVCR